MRKIIFHYHLFKNAGTSIDAILKTNFPQQWTTKEFKHSFLENKAEIKLWCEQTDAIVFSSHTALLPPPVLENTQLFPIIFIRHPIDRIASAYYFERKQNVKNHSAELAKNNNLEGYIRQHLMNNRAGQCRNFQSLRLAHYFGNQQANPELALQAVKQLPFVGLVDEFNQSLIQLTQWLKPHFSEFHAKPIIKNVTQKEHNLEERLNTIKQELGEAFYIELLQINASDIAVYDYVKAKYIDLHKHKIVQYWHTAQLPNDIVPLTKSWQTQPSHFEYVLFNDTTARQYLIQHFPAEYISAFDKCALPAMRSDFFRYAYLYNEGGIYIDAGISCIKPLEQWLDFTQDLVLIRKFESRIINGFIMSKAKHPFLKRVLEQCIINIEQNISNNIWLVTGPGILNNLSAELQAYSQLTIMPFTQFKQYCAVHNNLAHKKIEHWSLIQQQQSIFTQIPIIQATDEKPIKQLKLIAVGHPRCGSGSLTTYLNTVGLDIGHEKIKNDGICSWWLAARYNKNKQSFICAPKEEYSELKTDIICHYLRNPIEAIPSIIIENEFKNRDNNSFKHRCHIIQKHFAINLNDFSPVLAATLSYIYWNVLIEQTIQPNFTIRIENMNEDLKVLLSNYAIELVKTIPKVNTSALKYGINQKEAIDILQIMALLDETSQNHLVKYLNMYNVNYNNNIKN